ncbi:pentatricopeptide repeat protein [Aspergillus heteromorphus CBS 117.55]|uniref:Pentatricopeptide repeat protein n=1 Tax=Aspergillus heteromorphus CBS 117.55 TaxID=1448321 RepID=A0A317VB98_9EURO|nr:pentatricopeptide repeat protein [Aspergillus heteromorphus CBS 117.55]PWY71634.1 pentatricopeptide repeat protein [Aspergillus heteromorphus CBS 117.55]
MPRPTVILGGLWSCLCASSSVATLHCARYSLLSEKRLLKRSSSVLRGSLSSFPRRCHGTLYPRPRQQTLEIVEEDGNYSEKNGHGAPRNDGVSSMRIKSSAPESFEELSTSRLEHMLQERVTKNPSIPGAMQILRYLIQVRGVNPETRHYRCLILAHSDPNYGSPQVVLDLLKEMEGNGIPADSATLHAVLQVLAVHPDYLLRQDIVRTLRHRWLTLSPAGWHFLVAGLIREHQFELALDHIEQMERKGSVVENWLPSLLIYYICDYKEFDEVLRLMRSRTSRGHDISLELWSYVLDMASAASHHETTRYIWRKMVELKYLQPSDQTCENVLKVAAKAGDVVLAGSVMRFLVDAKVPLKLEYYERVVKAHVMSGDLRSGFQILCQMHMTGISLEPSSTLAIYNHLTKHKTTPRDAWRMLKDLKASKRDIPIECAEVIFEVCGHFASENPHWALEGIALYKELYALCPDKVNVSVYNVLIDMCRQARNVDAGMFVVEEIAALGVVPDQTTFEYLIMMCLETGNFESAYNYFEDMLAHDALPRPEICTDIRKICGKSRDHFATRLRYHSRIMDGARDDGINDTHHESPRTEHSSSLDTGARWAREKEQKKKTRRKIACERAQEEEGWLDYEPGGLIPEDQLAAKKDDK